MNNYYEVNIDNRFYDVVAETETEALEMVSIYGSVITITKICKSNKDKGVYYYGI